MSRFFSVLWAFEIDVDPAWTAQEIVLDWLNIQLGDWVDDENAKCDSDDEEENEAWFLFFSHGLVRQSGSGPCIDCPLGKLFR
jgi:hypothetical protein